MIKVTVEANGEQRDLECSEHQSIKNLLEILGVEVTKNTAYLFVDNKTVDIDNELEILGVKDLERIIY